MAGGLPGLGALGALMGGGGLTLPDIPCGVCVLDKARNDSAGNDHPEPAKMVTVVLGTPVCALHGQQLVHTIRRAPDTAPPSVVAWPHGGGTVGAP